MKEIMVKSNFNTIDDYILDFFRNRRLHRKQDLAFVVLENNNIPWSWYKEKMLQLLLWNMQGGVTGAGTGHSLYFAKEETVLRTLSKIKKEGKTHAMVCQIGMILCGYGDQISLKTPVQNFYEWSETDSYVRGHILARADVDAKLHKQHFEVNLTKWNGEDFINIGKEYERSDENIHDDYTPLWIKSSHLPKIENFSHDQRRQKWFTYPHRNYDINEENLYNYIKTNTTINTAPYESSNKIIDALYRSQRNRFYYENNERQRHPNKKYDVIFAPTAGITAEYFYEKCGHKNTKVIVYDYDELFLKVKKTILDMCLTGNDLINYMEYLSKTSDPIYLFSTNRTPNQSPAIEYNENLDYDVDEIREKLSLCSVDYMKLNLLESDFNKIKKYINNKNVLFYTSNIFRYVKVNLAYDYPHIKNQYKLLNEILSSSKSYDLWPQHGFYK